MRGIHRSPGEFPSQRPVTRSFAIFFDLHLNKRLSKQSRRRWFEMPPHSLWWYLIDLVAPQDGLSSVLRFYIDYWLSINSLRPSEAVCISNHDHHWSRSRLVAVSAPSQCLNQWRIIINWTLVNEFQWNLNQDAKLSFKKISLKMASVKWRPFGLGLDMLIWPHLYPEDNTGLIRGLCPANERRRYFPWAQT